MYDLLVLSWFVVLIVFFFFNDTATTEIYTLSLHDALPISRDRERASRRRAPSPRASRPRAASRAQRDRSARCTRGDRKSTRLNSSHGYISYAVFCLKKKKKKKTSLLMIENETT